MINTISKCERLNCFPPTTVAGADVLNAPKTVWTGNNSSATVLVDRTGDTRDFAYRYIQNVGATQIKYALNQDACSAAEYHGTIDAGSQLAVPTMAQVSIFGAGAWSVATLELYRTQG